MDHSLVIRQNQSPWLALGTTGCGALMAFGVLTPFQLSDFRQQAFAFAFLVPALLFSWAYFIGRSRVIEFDLQSNEVVIVQRSLLGLRQRTTIQLSSYNRVGSYLTTGRFTQNILALFSVDERRYFTLVSFLPSSESTGFLAIPSPVESQAARQLRERLCADLALVDLGFLNTYVPENYKHLVV
ncbi:MAG TPA: hypothetical protein VGM81_20245 [Burkholderiaceae bacterium]|jgi:hypothetical protein